MAHKIYIDKLGEGVFRHKKEIQHDNGYIFTKGYGVIDENYLNLFEINGKNTGKHRITDVVVNGNSYINYENLALYLKSIGHIIFDSVGGSGSSDILLQEIVDKLPAPKTTPNIYEATGTIVFPANTQSSITIKAVGDLSVTVNGNTETVLSDDTITYSTTDVLSGEITVVGNYFIVAIGDYILSYNFDLTLDWSSLRDGNAQPFPVTDQVTFEQWLAFGNDGLNNVNEFTNIVIIDFIKIGNNIKCNLIADAPQYCLSALNIINADKIGNINISQSLYLSGNQIVAFNPAIPLSNSLLSLHLDFNQMTIQGYIDSEVWATNQPSFTSTCEVNFSDNIDSVVGTNLETILLSKNCTITT